MKMNPSGKYLPFTTDFELTDRMWPNHKTTQAPMWCDVSLRDGNQALVETMNVEQKVEMFGILVKCGFKEIEVGFPASSSIEYTFVRYLIENNLIPDDVTIQVLVQANRDQIKTTCECLVGAKRVIIHIYNSTSPTQRRIVFKMEKKGVVELAVQGVRWVKKFSNELLTGTEVLFQYSPESFSATETGFALEICEEVKRIWSPTPEHKIILNLPETVEVATPNIYADQIEWFCGNIIDRNSVIISVHTHNDRGTGVAATELAMLAGADRVEGTLFGNGERTGNCDLITVALNLYTQGINPKLDLSNIPEIREVYERCTGMKVPPRQPYSGDAMLVAFSGSHQDAIAKGLAIRKVAIDKGETIPWDVPYMNIDPTDIGRSFEEVIRITSQSGKGGIAYLLETGCGIRMPKDMQREFGKIAFKQIEKLDREATFDDLRKMFWKEYIEREIPFKLDDLQDIGDGTNCSCQATITYNGQRLHMRGEGNGLIDAFICSLRNAKVADVHVSDYTEHALSSGEDALAISYVKLQFPNGTFRWGAGVNKNSKLAPILAVLSALNRE